MKLPVNIGLFTLTPIAGDKGCFYRGMLLLGVAFQVIPVKKKLQQYLVRK